MAVQLIWLSTLPRSISLRPADRWPMSFCRSQPVRQRFLFLRAGKSPRIRRRNPLRNLRHSTRCGRIPIGRLPEPTLLNSARFRPHWWTNCTRRGSIYANDHRPNPSLVFLHRDQHGKVRGATLRDTKHQSVFRPCLGNKLYRLVRGRRSRQGGPHSCRRVSH